jgi:hypothetical protein
LTPTCDRGDHQWVNHGSYRRAADQPVRRRRCTRCGRTASEATGRPTSGMRAGSEPQGGTTRWDAFWSTLDFSRGLAKAIPIARAAAGIGAPTASRWVRAVVLGRRLPPRPFGLYEEMAMRITCGVRDAVEIDPEDLRDPAANWRLFYAARAVAAVVTGRPVPNWLARGAGQQSATHAGVPLAQADFREDQRRDRGVRYYRLLQDGALIAEVRTRRRVIGRARAVVPGVRPVRYEYWVQFEQRVEEVTNGRVQLRVPERCRRVRGWGRKGDLVLPLPDVKPARYVQLSLF